MFKEVFHKLNCTTKVVKNIQVFVSEKKGEDKNEIDGDEVISLATELIKLSHVRHVIGVDQQKLPQETQQKPLMMY